MFLTHITWQIYSRLLAKPTYELDSFSALDVKSQRTTLAQRLREQIQYFGSRSDALPEWRDAADTLTDTERFWTSWPTLPILTKNTLNSRFDPVEIQRRFRLRGRVNATGGSTGEPTRFFLDEAMLRASRGSHIYSQQKMGWRPGMTTIIIWGSERDIGKQVSPIRHLAHRLYRNHLIAGFHLTDDAVARVHDIIRRESPVAIYGYSTLLENLAERSLTLGLQAEPGRVVVAWNGAEMLYERQIELFRRVFGVPILNRYGGRELSMVAFQEREAAPLRIVRPWIYLEVVDDAGKPAAPGEIGRLILTSTVCRGTPFIRYDIGDLGSFSSVDCDESGIKYLRAIHGRHLGSIRLNDGRIISSAYWNHLLKDYPEVSQFQVRISAQGSINLLLSGSGFTPARHEELTGTLRLLLGNQPVRCEWVRTIPRTPQGKLMQVVRE